MFIVWVNVSIKVKHDKCYYVLQKSVGPVSDVNPNLDGIKLV
jgi:hypothetical protein